MKLQINNSMKYVIRKIKQINKFYKTIKLVVMTHQIQFMKCVIKKNCGIFLEIRMLEIDNISRDLFHMFFNK